MRIKLTTLVLLISLLQVSAASFGQKITLKEKNIAIDKVFREIQKQTGMGVFFKKSNFNKTKKIEVAFVDAPLETVMEKVLSGTGMTYVVEENTIIVTPKEKSFLDRIVERWQNIDVTGRILDENGKPLVGANVKIKDTGVSTSTDADGRFTLRNVEEDAIIQISYVGYKTREVKSAKNLGELRMEVGNSGLEEVVVNGGYYEVEAIKKTGNIYKVDGEKIEGQPLTSPLLALQGRVPGVEISPSSGAPGAAAKILIRGQNSIRTSATSEVDANLPLYVIDGVPINSAPITSGSMSLVSYGFDPLSTIDPSNIASIEILKDGDATSIYGSRGANGVILITTKNKIASTGLNFDSDYNRSIGTVANRFSMLNTAQYVEMRKEAIRNDGQRVIDMFNDPVYGRLYFPDIKFHDTTSYTDWQEELVGHQTITTNLRLRLNGGTNQTKFSLGGGFYKETMPFPGDFGLNRYNIDVGLNHKTEDNKLRIAFNGSFGVNDSKIFDASQLMSNALWISPNRPSLYDNNGALNWGLMDGIATFNNPLAALRKSHNQLTNNLLSSGIVEYNISNNLSLKSNIGVTRMDLSESLKEPISSLNPYGNEEKVGTNRVNKVVRTSWIAEPQLTYKLRLNNHAFSALVGATVQESVNSISQLVGMGYTSDALLETLSGAATITSNAEYDSRYRYGSLFTRLGYDYNSKYIVSATIRRDGSSRFGPNERFGNFWSLGGAWLLSNENWLKDSKAITFFKLRGSYGTTGNDQISDFRYVETFRKSQFNYGGLVALQPTNLFNPDFSWEVTQKSEIAIEAEILNRVSFEAALYINRSSNQLVDNYKLPAITGFSGVLANLDAVIENRGWEFAITSKNFTGSKFTWTTSFNISGNKNKLVSFPGLSESSYYQTFKIGEPLNIQRTYEWTGVDPTTGLHTVRDLNGDGAFNNLDMIFSRSLDTKYFGGLENTFSYKNFELSFLFQFSDRVASVRYFGAAPGGNMNQPSSVMERWQKPGDITNVQRFSTEFGSGRNPYNRYLASDAMLQDIRFLKLRSFALTYNVSKVIKDKLKLQNLKLYALAQNLLTISNFDAWDPETLYGAPVPRIVTFGINVGL